VYNQTDPVIGYIEPSSLMVGCGQEGL